MRFKLLIFLLSVAACISTYGQPAGFNYSSAGIPDSLKEKANAVYRVDEGYVFIISSSHFDYRNHSVITLLNKKAANHLRKVLAYDRFTKVESVQVAVYDSLGIKVKEYNKKDFETRNYDDRMSIFTDAKLLDLEMAAPYFPCTVEVTYETKSTGYIELPDWTIASPGEAVEHSVFTVRVPADLDIRHKSSGIVLNPTVTTDANNKIYKWEARNLIAPKQTEENSYESGAYFPAIQIAPVKFDYDGYKGEMKSWQSFGAWNYPLYEDARSFTEAQVQEVRSMIADCKTDREKISALYNYLKKSMRYVSVQLGIGGFKPFPVQYVYDKQYGDCKALTNYMRYMLKVAGIPSYPALVNAGSKKPSVDPGFPSDYFNHVILCVPLLKDSMWLECTSKNNTAGVLGSFTENKNALLLTEKGGVLVATPKSKSANNLLSTKTIIQLDQDGGSKVSSSLYCTGDFWNLFYQIEQQTNEDKKTIFTNYLHYKVPDEFLLQHMQDSAGGVSYSLLLTYDQLYSFKTGSKLFFEQRVNKLFDETVQYGSRQEDYLFAFPYQKTDTTIYILPARTVADNFPSPLEIVNDYVSYKSECLKKEDNKLFVVSQLIIKQPAIPSSAYEKISDSFRQISQNESRKIVLKRI